MKYSLKLLGGLAAIGFSASTGLTALAQQAPGTQPNPDRNSYPNVPSGPQTGADQSPTQPEGMTQQPSVSVPADTKKASIDSIVRRSTSFDLFNALVRVADSRGANLGTLLASRGSYTVFAPTDAAFLALPEGTIKQLVQPENQKTLVRILSQHIVKGKLLSSAIQPGSKQPVKGDALNLQASGGSVTVNGAQVVRPDIEASNGVIHAIDQVILPSDVQAKLNLAPRASGRSN